VRPSLLSIRLAGLGLAVGVTLVALLSAQHRSPAAPEKPAVVVKKVDYAGWKNNLSVNNGDVELIITLDVGPRIISYKMLGGKNVFKEYSDQLGKSGEKDWQIRGGHRLWIGPEDLTRTYFADNGQLKYEEIEGGVRLLPPTESEFGTQKEIDVKLEAKGTKVRVTHRIRNHNKTATDLAPWALSVMAPGGIEIIPLPEHKPHPGSPKNARSPADFAPNQTMSLWPFFDFKDPRWTMGTKYLTLKQDAKKGPTKIGLSHRAGWVAYLNGGTLFVKRFAYEEGKTYPDNGVNFETFTNEDMLEIESLGPLLSLPWGKDVEHVETWELFKGVEDVTDEASIDKNVLPKLTGK
jgi:hypothetical protein